VIQLGCSSKIKKRKNQLTERQIKLIDSLKLVMDLDMETAAKNVPNNSYLKDTIFSGHLLRLKMGIRNNTIPEFLYSECLDNEYIFYYTGSSHKKNSLRTDLINNLDSVEVNKLVTVADSNGLMKLCNKRMQFMINNSLTTWEIIKEKINK